MAYNRVFAGVIGIVVLLSCKNDHSLSLYGLVTEADNGQAIANATVIFQTTRGKMIDSVYTNEEGKFKMNEGPRKGERYSLVIRDEHHFSESILVSGNQYEYNFELKAFAYLKLRLKKNSIDSNQIFVSVDSPSFFFRRSLVHYSIFDSILPTVIIPSRQTAYINWHVMVWPYQPETWTGNLNNPVNLNKNDTSLFLIEYD